MNKAQNIDVKNYDNKIKIAITGSFTLNGISETFIVKCAENKIDCNTFVSNYSQYNQDILNSNSDLYSFFPNVTFLILDTRSILGQLFFNPFIIPVIERQKFIENKIAEIKNLIDAYVKTKSKLIITNFLIPTYSSYGIYDEKIDYGLKEMIYDLNQKLSNLVKNYSSVFLYDFNGFVTRCGETNIFVPKQYYFGDIKISLDYIPKLVDELMGFVKTILGLNKKCIVLDLDNTLWGGIVGEDGFNGIQLGGSPIGNAFVEFQQHLLALQQRGIILAINSKNNFEDALQVIKEHPHMILRENNFSSMKINWNDKVSNMKEIANDINIGLDSMVFFDDDLGNQEYVQKSLKQVFVPKMPHDPTDYSQFLQDLNEFNVLKITEEDQKRGEMYSQELERKYLKNLSYSLENFLQELEIKMKFLPADQFTIPRISQLTLKTNQFNLTTKRYQEEDIQKFSDDKNMIVECVKIEDKFGNNGITGVYIIRKNNSEEWLLDTFLLSCRIMGKDIEKGILAKILQKAKDEGVKKVKMQYIPTKKNKPVEEFLPNTGFTNEGDYWVFDLKNEIMSPKHLEVI